MLVTPHPICLPTDMPDIQCTAAAKAQGSNQGVILAQTIVCI